MHRIGRCARCVRRYNYNHDAASAEAMVESIGADRALAVQADAGSLDSIIKLIDTAVAKFGRIDTLLANAGITKERNTQVITEEDFDGCFDLNVKGPLFLAQV